MGTRKVKREKETPLTTRECIRRLLVGDASDVAKDCILWAESRYAVLRRHEDAAEGEREAAMIIDDWRKAVAARALWASRGLTDDTCTLENEEGHEAVTIGELHGFLTRLLAVHPEVAEIGVFHHECCGVIESTDIVFNVEKARLEMS